MNNDAKTVDYMVQTLPDGSRQVQPYDLICASYQARMAHAIVVSVSSILNSDDDDKPSPKAIASFACEIAQQLMEQFRARGWVIDLPAPLPPSKPSA